MIRKEEADAEFRKKLQNPLNPINDTSVSPEMEQYLDDLNNGRLSSKDKEQKKKVKMLLCPVCRRGHALKRIPSGYQCGYCGIASPNPLVSYQ